MTQLYDKPVKPSFEEILNAGTFLVTGRSVRPKGTDIDEMIEHVDLLKDLVDGMNVTDNQSSVMRYPSLATALIIKEHGGEPILQMTCRDRNRLALEADLLFAYSRGVRSVLCLTGDSVPVGDHKGRQGCLRPGERPALQLIKSMEEGKDLGSNELNAADQVLQGRHRHARGRSDRAAKAQVREEGRGGGAVLPDPGRLRHGQLPAFHGAGPQDRRQGQDLQPGWYCSPAPEAIKYMNNNVPGVFIPENLA